MITLRSNEIWRAGIAISLIMRFASSTPGKPGYGSYDYNGYGHRGYNEAGVTNKIVDYYSKPQYAFGYEVEDYYQQLSHGRWEVRDGDVTQGQYRVLLPDGRLQIVSYIADKLGYRPSIQYIGKGVHPPPPPSYAQIKPPKHIQDPYFQHRPILTELLPLSSQPMIVKKNVIGYPIAILPTPTPIIQTPLNPGSKFDGEYGVDGNHVSFPPREQLSYLPSSKTEVKLSPAKIARRRALLYNRTLFRRDLPAPPSIPR